MKNIYAIVIWVCIIILCAEKSDCSYIYFVISKLVAIALLWFCCKRVGRLLKEEDKCKK